MKTEDLKAIGLTQEQIDEVFRLNGLDIKKQTDEIENLKGELGKLDEANTKIESLNGMITERDSQLEELKSQVGDVETLKARITELQETNAKSVLDYENKLNELITDSAINLRLNGKVHDIDIASSLIDKSKLVMDNGKIIGLDEQIESLKETKGFLFITDDPAPAEATPEEPPAEGGGFQKVGLPPAQGGDSEAAAIAQAFGNLED